MTQKPQSGETMGNRMQAQRSLRTSNSYGVIEVFGAALPRAALVPRLHGVIHIQRLPAL